MQNDKNKQQNEEESQVRKEIHPPKEHHSSAFREPNPDREKSTINTEEADLEQERKDAMTERD